MPRLTSISGYLVVQRYGNRPVSSCADFWVYTFWGIGKSSVTTMSTVYFLCNARKINSDVRI
jgi:hypothetical protein